MEHLVYHDEGILIRARAKYPLYTYKLYTTIPITYYTTIAWQNDIINMI